MANAAAPTTPRPCDLTGQRILLTGAAGDIVMR